MFTTSCQTVVGYNSLIAVADKGYDADWFITNQQIANKAELMVPSTANRKKQRVLDGEKYKGRNMVGQPTNRPRFYSKIATRFDNLARNYGGLIMLAAAFPYIKSNL